MTKEIKRMAQSVTQVKTPRIVLMLEVLSWLYASAITAFGAWYVFRVTFHKIPEGNEQMTHTILGFVMGTMITTALSFVFNIATRYMGGEKEVIKTKPALAPLSGPSRSSLDTSAPPGHGVKLDP